MEKKWITKPFSILLVALVVAVLWGSAYPTVKLGMEWFGIAADDSASKLLFAGVRFTLAGTMVIAFASAQEKRLIRPRRSELGRIVLLGLILTSAQEVFYCIGLANTSASKCAILFCSGTFLAVLSAPLLVKGEKLSARKVLGCLVGFVGVTIVNGITGLTAADTAFSLMGEGCILIAAMCFGFGSTWSKSVTAECSPTTVTAYQMLSGGLLLCVIGPAVGGKLTVSAPYALFMMCYLAFLSAGAYSLWTLLLKYNDVGKVTVYNFLVPVFGTALSGLLLREDIFTAQNIAALVLVCAGIVIVNYAPAGKKSGRS